MLTLLIALICGVTAGLLSTFDLHWAWCVFNGFVVFIIVQLICGLLVRKKVNKVNARVQEIMNIAQNKINRKMQAFQRRPSGSVKSVQKTLEKDQAASIREAMEATSAAEPLYKWNFLLKKQINTMRMLFHYQLREFKKVDELMPGCLMFDARSVAFKVARMYRNNDPKLDKLVNKKIKRMKGDDCALMYSLYAWILVKREQVDKALEVLIAAKKKTDNPTILENWDKLVNGKVKQFSNSGLGEMWYALNLEEPKIKAQKQRQNRRGGFR